MHEVFRSAFRVARKRFEILLAVLLAGFYFGTKDLSDCYDKTIMAEGHGYYTYLLATHVYCDYTFEFFNTLYPEYYCQGFDPPDRNFINEFDGIRVNKYYPGTSLLWLPFFLVAHLLAVLSGLTADGYSDIYQHAIGLAGISYTILGFHFTRRTMERFGVSFPVQAIVCIALLFGTNLLIYSGAWSSQSHAYSFFLIATLCWYMFRLFDDEEQQRTRVLSIVLVLAALAVTVRPQNLALFFLLPFFGADFKKLKRIFSESLFTKRGIAGSLVAGAVIFRVLYYWHLQSGKWFLNPYHGESYDLSSPHLIDILFSFRKGWLLYAPFLVIGLAGVLYFPKTRQRINLLLFWLMLIYVSSCWWCWTYSQTSFGQRTFVDFYGLIGLQAGVLAERTVRRFRMVLMVLVPVFIALNLLQTHQYRIGILDGDRCDREYYFKNFFSIRPVASYPIPESSIVMRESIVEDFDHKQSDYRVVPSANGGGMSTFISDSVIYSDGITSALPLFLEAGELSHIRARINVTAPYGAGSVAYLVIDLKRNGNSFGYASFPLQPYIHSTGSTELEFGIEMPETVRRGDIIKMYGWKKEEDGQDTLYFDRMQLEFIRTDSSLVLVKR